MEKFNYLISQLPLEQIKWLLSIKKSWLKPQYTQKSNYNKYFMEIIERKAFYKGYIDLVILLNTANFETYFINENVIFKKNNKNQNLTLLTCIINPNKS